MAAGSEVVPFGKYKDQPVEVLAQDKQYCDWLLQQEWFQARYTSIHTLIINNFGAPTETPEHNALQALFLDERWVKAFVVAVVGGVAEIERRFRERNSELMVSVLKDLDGLRGDSETVRGIVRRYDLPYSWSKATEARARCEQVLTRKLEHARTARWQTELCVSNLEFESEGTDVSFIVNNWVGIGEWSATAAWGVECKPSLGDDYPAVLRQMGRHQDHILLLGSGGYNGRGATLEQVTKIFAMSHIRVICVGEVDAALAEMPSRM